MAIGLAAIAGRSRNRWLSLRKPRIEGLHLTVPNHQRLCLLLSHETKGNLSPAYHNDAGYLIFRYFNPLERKLTFFDLAGFVADIVRLRHCRCIG